MAKRIDWHWAQESLAHGVSLNAVGNKIQLDRSTLHKKAKKLRWATPLWVKQSLDSLIPLQTAHGVPVWEDGGALGASVRAALAQARLKMDLMPDGIVDGLIAGESTAFAFRTNREIQAREAKRREKLERLAPEHKAPTAQDSQIEPHALSTLMPQQPQGEYPESSHSESLGMETEKSMLARPGSGGALHSGAGAQGSESSTLAEVDLYSLDRAELLVEVRKLLKTVKAENLPLKEVTYLRNLVTLHKELMGRETESEKGKAPTVYINIAGLSELGRNRN